jgi:hypothetical protein
LEDFAAEKLWPDFVRGSADMGIRSMLSVHLFVESDNLGALNMYSTAPDAFTEDDETVGLLRAAHTGIAMQGSRTESNLCAAIVSRDAIGQAKGILMERYKSIIWPHSYCGEGFTTHRPQAVPHRRRTGLHRRIENQQPLTRLPDGVAWRCRDCGRRRQVVDSLARPALGQADQRQSEHRRP